MTLKQYLLLMTISTLIAWSGVALVVTQTDPGDAQTIVFGVFYLSLFLALCGTLSVIGFILRVVLLKKNFYISREVLVSLRQACLLSFLFVATMYLNSKSLLSIWIAIALVAMSTAAEFVFVSAKIRR
jgi:hypothetical protein